MKRFKSLFLFVGLLSMAVLTSSYVEAAKSNTINPCKGSIGKLEHAYKNDRKFRVLIDSAFENMRQLPQGYPGVNPWIGKEFKDLAAFFGDWCTFLPGIKGSHDDGLKYIQEFAWFYYQNEYGMKFVKESPGREITQQFSIERGHFLSSGDSKGTLSQWTEDPRIEIEDYVVPKGGYTSFNDFFKRPLKNQAESRPQTMPDRDYIIAAPTDCIMNSVPQKITNANTKIKTKFRQELNIKEMLNGSKYANEFVGGTALSCVLMPNTYHHYHAPTSGDIVEAKVVHDAYYGYDDFPKWVPPNGNVGYHGTDFSQFEDFQRGYFILKTKNFGYVAMIPVGLDTISSIVFNEKFTTKKINAKHPVAVQRGDELGHFLYGGSLFIMIFEEDRYKSDAIQVRLGNQIGTFDTPPLKK